MKSIKSFLNRSVAGKPIQLAKSKMNASVIVRLSGGRPPVKTVYCISPYKTGTTYLSLCYTDTVALHEPYHLVTLKNLPQNFDEFFIQRNAALNVQLECSGFWSGYIPELQQHDFAKELDYMAVLRSPVAWINSLVNHWSIIRASNRFDYINEFFWKQKLGIDLALPVKKGLEAHSEIEALGEFYMNYLEQVKSFKHIDFVQIKDLDAYLQVLDQKLGVKSQPNKSWKRKAVTKDFVYENEELEIRYQEFLKTIDLFRPN